MHNCFPMIILNSLLVEMKRISGRKVEKDNENELEKIWYKKDDFVKVGYKKEAW